MKNIVTAEWLLENLNEDNLVLLDCRFNLSDSKYGVKSYRNSHIPKALFVDMECALTGEVKKHGGRHPLPNMNDFAIKMESLGVDDNSIVVVYDDGDLAGASRLWWMLKFTGKDSVFVLEGGFNNWVKMGYQITNNPSQIRKKGILNIKTDHSMICDMNFVKNSIGKDNVIIVDSRARERYLGLVEPVDKKAGHIPGAVNYFWQEILDGVHVKDIDRLKERFKDLEKYDKIIVHCGSGITACPNLLAMDEIGLKPIHYAGAWSDWISYEDNPIETVEK